VQALTGVDVVFWIKSSVQQGIMRNFIANIKSEAQGIFRTPRDNPELVQAKLAAFSKHVPLLYALLVSNTLALAITHMASAPTVLTVYIPATLDLVCIVRMIMWLRTRNRAWSPEQAIGKLRNTIVFAGFLGAGFTAWSLSLFPYGDAYTKGHVAFFMAVTVIGCGFCLMHLRLAVLIVMGFVVIPFAVYFASTGNTVFISIAINFVIVAVAIVFMLFVNYRDFEDRINYQKALLAKQAELQSLSDVNFRNSNTDPLTGLPNRRGFFSELKQRIELATWSGGNLGVGILDLDGFKPINDVHGHPTGDRLLIEVGQRLCAQLGASVFLARIGGDEFAMITEVDASDRDIVAIGEKIAELLQAPFEVQGTAARIGGSIGFAQFPSAARDAEALFERADYALYFAKQHDRGNLVIFSLDHEAEIRQASAIAQALINADLEQELWIAYQPIIDVETSQPVCFEALARWRSPALGDVPPSIFILAAERTGLITQLTPILLRKALAGARQWPDHIRISFNLSTVDITSPLSILKVANVVEQSGVRADRIDFEITETAAMRNFSQARQALNVLRQLGARISLDDFGTGYSSLSCIRELPLDKVKIDRGFTMKIETESASRLIVRTMINLCENLGLDCVVEGIETLQQKDILRSGNCRYMQGYLFAKPMSADQVPGFIAGMAEGEVRHGSMAAEARVATG
jgi:diguanylate cyclase (GGDEF)-like protein